MSSAINGLHQSYTGVELLRVLVKNKPGPILMIAFTNHALDHLLQAKFDSNFVQTNADISQSKQNYVALWRMVCTKG